MAFVNKRRSVLLLCLVAFAVLGLLLDAHNDVKKFPQTPYGMMLRDGCDPEQTYYRQTIAMEDYYIPWAAYNQVRTNPSVRYADQAFLGFNYPDLSYIIEEGKTPEDRRKKITIKIDDLKKVATMKSIFAKDIKHFNLKEQQKNIWAFVFLKVPPSRTSII